MRSKAPITTEHERLGEALKKERRKAGLTQVHVAQLLGRPQSFVAKVESGDRRLETLEFVAYCRLIRTDPLSLLKDFI